MEQSPLYDGVILDVDGTIWNTTGLVAVAWNKAIEETFPLSHRVTASELQKEFGKTMNVIAYDLWPELSASERDVLIANCCTEEHIKIKENTLDICYGGVVETIKSLSADINFYIVSNCQNGYIELLLEKTGLSSFIKDFECYGRTGKGKAENIIILSHRNNLHNPVYVGDTEGDFNACKQSGINFIWATYGFGKGLNCPVCINNFSELGSKLWKM